MISRSNSATPESIVSSIRRLDGFEASVSIAWLTAMNRPVTRQRRELLAQVQHRTAEAINFVNQDRIEIAPYRGRHQAIKAGRLAFVPETPASTYSPADSQPRGDVLASSRKLQSQFWSVVDTRAKLPPSRM